MRVVGGTRNAGTERKERKGRPRSRMASRLPRASSLTSSDPPPAVPCTEVTNANTNGPLQEPVAACFGLWSIIGRSNRVQDSKCVKTGRTTASSFPGIAPHIKKSRLVLLRLESWCRNDREPQVTPELHHSLGSHASF